VQLVRSCATWWQSARFANMRARFTVSCTSSRFPYTWKTTVYAASSSNHSDVLYELEKEISSKLFQ